MALIKKKHFYISEHFNEMTILTPSQYNKFKDTSESAKFVKPRWCFCENNQMCLDE